MVTGICLEDLEWKPDVSKKIAFIVDDRVFV